MTSKQHNEKAINVFAGIAVILLLLVPIYIAIPLLVNSFNTTLRDEGTELCRYLGYDKATDWHTEDYGLLNPATLIFECDSVVVDDYECTVKDTCDYDKWGDCETVGWSIECINWYNNGEGVDIQTFDGKNNWWWWKK